MTGELQSKSSLVTESRAGGIGAFAALFSGLALDLSLAILFGAGPATDALFVALRIPIGIAVFFPPTAVQVLVPAMTRWLDADNDETANRNTSQIVIVTLLICAGVAGLGLLFSPALVEMMAPGLAPSTLDQATGMARIAFLTIPPAAASQVLRAYGHAKRRHGLASALQAVLGITVVGILFLSPGTAEVALVVWAYLVGSVAHLVASWLLARAQGFRFKWQLRTSVEMRSIGSNAIRPLAASAIQLGVRLTEQFAASFMAPGSITILTYANRLIGAVGGTLFFRPVVTAFLVPMSRYQSRGNVAAVRGLLGDALRLLIFVSAGLTVFVAIAGPPFVSGLFALGALTTEHAALLGLAVFAYSASLPTAAIQRVLLAVTFARLETSPYLRNTIYGALANLVALGILYTSWNGEAKLLIVPVAYAVAQLVNTAHAGRLVRSQLDGFRFPSRDLSLPLLVVLLSALAMIFAVVALQGPWGGSPVGLMATGLSTSIVGAIVLLVAAHHVIPGGFRAFQPREPALD